MVTVTFSALTRSTSGLLGDVASHAAYSEWLRTLPWWDWRGWSDWFYGGRAVGVHYPPLMHAIGRYTHPVWGQLAMTALGMLWLLPWAMIRLARAVGMDRRAQLAAMAFMLVVVPVSGYLSMLIHGLHVAKYFGLGPSMMAVCLGMLAAGDAAVCRKPLTAGLLLALGALFNIASMMGVLVVIMVLLGSSGADWKQACRWLTTAGTMSLTITSWWIVPFLAGSTRLADWRPLLSDDLSKELHPALYLFLAIVLIVAVESVKKGDQGVRRMALASAVTGVGSVVLDVFGFHYADRLLMPALLAALVSGAWLIARLASHQAHPGRSPRPSVLLIGGCITICALVIVPRLEILPAIVWLMRGAPKTLRALSALLSMTFVFLSMSVIGVLTWQPTFSVTPQAQAADATGDETGVLMFDELSDEGQGRCSAIFPGILLSWTHGRVKPLTMYGQFARPTEFVRGVDPQLRLYQYSDERSRWTEAISAKGEYEVDPARMATLLGATWLAQCDPDLVLVGLPVSRVSGHSIEVLASDDEWHRAAVKWWVDVTAEGAEVDVGAVPVFSSQTPYDTRHYPPGTSAQGTALQEGPDRLVISAVGPGWAWVRVTWDPWWTASTGAPVLKGGPGHIVVWAEQGVTELTWDVPTEVDGAAAALTGVAAASTAALAVVNRRQGFRLDANRKTPAADAVRVFYDTVDEWMDGLLRRTRKPDSETSDELSHRPPIADDRP